MAGGEVLAALGMVAAASGGLVLGRVRTVDMRRQRDEALERLHTDDLTMLPNRRALYRELGRRTKAGEAYTVAMLDMDRFKAINDRFGHDLGDWVLLQFAMRLHEVARRLTGYAGRLHGDEFVVVLPAMSDDQAALAAAEIHECTADLLVVLGHMIFPWATVGVAAAAVGDSPRDVLHRADVALYRAKRKEVSVALFDPAVDMFPPPQEDRPTVRLRELAELEPDRGVAA